MCHLRQMGVRPVLMRFGHRPPLSRLRERGPDSASNRTQHLASLGQPPSRRIPPSPQRPIPRRPSESGAPRWAQAWFRQPSNPRFQHVYYLSCFCALVSSVSCRRLSSSVRLVSACSSRPSCVCRRHLPPVFRFQSGPSCPPSLVLGRRPPPLAPACRRPSSRRALAAARRLCLVRRFAPLLRLSNPVSL